MLQNSFLHVPGIRGIKTEKQLWDKGVLRWDDLRDYQLKHGGKIPLNFHRQLSQKSDWYDESVAALESGDVDYFLDRMPHFEHYRIAIAYPWEALFLDIETTGLNVLKNHITMIGWSLGGKYNVYVPGLDSQDLLLSDIAKAKSLVTYNGKIFDLKYLFKELEGLKLPKVHVDLRYFSQKLGLKGGQKVLEKSFGLVRQNASGDGKAAVRRYGEYRSGNIESMEELVKYNQADVEGMKHIFDACIKLKIELGQIPNIAGLDSTFVSLVQKGVICYKESRKKSHHFGGSGTGIYRPRFFNYRAMRNISLLHRHSMVGLFPLPGSQKVLFVSVISDQKIKPMEMTYNKLLFFLSMFRPKLIAIGCPPDLHAEAIGSSGGIWFDKYPKVLNLLNVFRCLGQAVILVSNNFVHDMFGLKKIFAADDLSEALTLFGYHGITADISFPRLQSVVSALAGQLFWSGKFETADLGQERLILPDVNCGQPLWRERQIVGLTGESGVGKTTIANFLENNYNFTPAMSRWVTPAGVGKKLWPDVYNYMGPRKIVVDCLPGLREVACWKSCFGPSFVHVEVMRTSQVYEQKIVNSTKNKTKANVGYYGDAFSVRSDLSINNKYKISNLEELLSVIFDNNLLSLT